MTDSATADQGHPDHPEGRDGRHGRRPVRLLGPAEIRALATELDVTPTKKLGQNFVVDPNTVRRIVAAAGVGPDDHVMEVGPGLGSLTLAVLDVGADVTAVEIDERLAGRLPATVADRAPDHVGNLRTVVADALRVTRADLAAAGAPAPTALVANLPYNVSVPVLLHILEEFPTVTRVLVMVQLEVADRLAAAPGSKIYGVPSVKAGFHGAVSKAGTVGRTCSGRRRRSTPGSCVSTGTPTTTARGRTTPGCGGRSSTSPTPPSSSAGRPSARR